MKKPEILNKLKEWRGSATAILATGVLLVLASFADKQTSMQFCTAIKIEIADKERYEFVDAEEVKSLITRNAGTLQILGSKQEDVDLEKIEAGLHDNPYIKDAEVYFDMQGKLKTTVYQKRPVLRVLNSESQQYYLDENGERFPISRQSTAHVPLATSKKFNITRKRDSVLNAIDSNLFVLAKYLEQNEFAGALAGQIIIENKKEFTIIPRLGDFEIYLGDLSELDDKFKRLEAFYKTSLPKVGWDKYKRITLKYKNQIIANR